MKNIGLISLSHKLLRAALGLVTACNTTTQTASTTSPPAAEQKTELISLTKRWCGPAADPARLELQTNGRTATKGGVTSSFSIAGNKATIIFYPKVMSWQGKQYVLTHVLSTNTMTMKGAISGETRPFVAK